MIRTDFELQSEAMYVLGKNELQIKNIGDKLVSKYSVFEFIAEGGIGYQIALKISKESKKEMWLEYAGKSM